VQGKLRIDLPKHCLQAIDEFSVPRQEFQAAVYVCRLVDLILLEPPGYSARNWVGSVAGEKSAVQFKQCVAEQCPFSRVDGRNVAPDTISECHS